MRGPGAPLVLSERIARNPRRFLDVIEIVLMHDYLSPDLRRRVISMQRRLIAAELAAHDEAAALGSRWGRGRA